MSQSNKDPGKDPKPAVEELYPAGIPPTEEDLRSLHLQRDAVLASSSSYFFVSQKYESLDYVKINNRLEVENEKTKTYRTKVKEDVQRITCFVLAGFVTAVVGVFVEAGVHYIGRWKFHKLSEYINENYGKSELEKVVFGLLWYLGVIIPVMFASCVVLFVAPFAVGGGVAQCIAYLNGVRVPHVLSLKGMLVKSLSTISCVVSGLAGGKEGPMMHIGTTAGGILPSFLPWKQLKSDHERRDLAASGFGGGIAVAFGAPIGGILLAMEEGISFWEVNLMLRSFLGILSAYFFSTLLMSFIMEVPGELSHTKLHPFGVINSELMDFKLFELILFAIEGVIGGLVGVSIIKIHIHLTLLRRRYVHNVKRKLLEAFIIACLAATLSWTALMTVTACSKYPGKENKPNTVSSNETKTSSRFIEKTSESHTVQLYCEDGQFSDMSLVFFQTQIGVMQSMFVKDSIHIESMIVYILIYYIYINLTLGMTLSAGLFVPNLLLGGVWGRLFGIALQNMGKGKWDWAVPAKYAYMGAAAQLSGVVGKTFSILVIMVEASGSVTLSIPLMIVVSVTRYVTTFFLLPIYETQMHLNGIPYLRSAPPPLSVSVTTESVMSPPPLVTLAPKPTVQTILNTLKSNNHNGFPIIGTESGVGLILRQQLLVLLKFQAYKHPPPFTPLRMCQCHDLYLKYSRTHIDLEKIEVENEFLSTQLDLSPYFVPYPYIVKEEMSLVSTYNLFRQLGLRHVVVVDDDNKAVGMITRKDLAKFHTWESLGRMGVKTMNVRP